MNCDFFFMEKNMKNFILLSHENDKDQINNLVIIIGAAYLLEVLDFQVIFNENPVIFNPKPKL